MSEINLNSGSVTTLLRPNDACPNCSSAYSWVVHGGACPKVRAVEYYPDGTIKRVEFHGPVSGGMG